MALAGCPALAIAGYFQVSNILRVSASSLLSVVVWNRGGKHVERERTDGQFVKCFEVVLFEFRANPFQDRVNDFFCLISVC